jgi:hypothetical protein
MSFFGRLSSLIERLQALPSAIENLAGAIRAATPKSADHEVSANKQEIERAAEQQRQYHVQVWIARGTWAAFLAASIYAGISLFQWREMQKQTVNSARAWLGYQQIGDSDLPVIVDRLEMVPRLNVEAHYRIENFGSGPAIKVTPTFWVATDTNLKMVRRTGAFLCSSAAHFATGTVPTAPSVETPGPMGSILFPKQIYNNSQTWSADAMPSLRWMLVMGCVAYLDQFKAPHWTRFAVLIGDGINPISSSSPRKLYTLFNDTDESSENDEAKN